MKRAEPDAAAAEAEAPLITETAANRIFQRALRDEVVANNELDAATRCFKALLKDRQNNSELQFRIGIVMMHLRIYAGMRFIKPSVGNGPSRVEHNWSRNYSIAIHRRQGLRKKGIVWLERAALQGHGEAAFRAGEYRLDHPTKVRFLNMAAAQNHAGAIRLLGESVGLIMSPLDHVAWRLCTKNPIDPDACAKLVRSVMLCAIGATRVLRGRGGPLCGKMHDETYMEYILAPLCTIDHAGARVRKRLPPWLLRRACSLAMSGAVMQIMGIVDGMSKTVFEHLLLKDEEVFRVVQWLRRK